MTELSNAMARLSGIRKALISALNENVSHKPGKGVIKTRANFLPDNVQHYFKQAVDQIETLKRLLPDLYNDFKKSELNLRKR